MNKAHIVTREEMDKINYESLWRALEHEAFASWHSVYERILTGLEKIEDKIIDAAKQQCRILDGKGVMGFESDRSTIFMLVLSNMFLERTLYFLMDKSNDPKRSEKNRKGYVELLRIYLDDLKPRLAKVEDELKRQNQTELADI